MLCCIPTAGGFVEPVVVMSAGLDSGRWQCTTFWKLCLQMLTDRSAFSETMENPCLQARGVPSSIRDVKSSARLWTDQLYQGLILRPVHRHYYVLKIMRHTHTFQILFDDLLRCDFVDHVSHSGHVPDLGFDLLPGTAIGIACQRDDRTVDGRNDITV